MSMIANEHLRIGQILVKNNKITELQLKEAVDEQEKQKAEARLNGITNLEIKKIGDVLVDKKYVTSKDVAEAIAEQYNLPVFDKFSLTVGEYDKNVVKMLRDTVAKEIQAIALRKDSTGKYFIVAVDPGDMKTKIKLKSLLKTDINLLDFNVISKDNFEGLFNHIYNIALSIDNIKKEREEENRRNLNRGLNLNDGSAIANIVDTVLSTAIQERVSDIHIESINNEVIVRYRVDTVPVIRQRFPREIEPMLVQRFYIECGLPVDQKNIPQDGRFERTFDGKRYDFRVNFMPAYLPDRMTSKISIRILNSDKLAADIKKIGFTDSTFETYDRMIHEPHGLILVVGPMGSGKTTTLYSSIAYLDPQQKIIITLEDPPEFSIEYVNQCKINNIVGFTYASGLKAILRQDADIILVGEIRDTEVGKLAIQSAEIGRLVFSTLHVDNAVSSVLRLKNLGIEPFFVSSVLVGVVSQRLVRRICPHCAQEYTPNPEDVKNASALLKKDLSGVKFKKGVGCQRCNGNGYLGLIPTYEVLNFKEITPLREAVANGTISTEILTNIAVQNGYKPMICDGYDKVVLGYTTFEEVNRIVLDVNGRKLIEKALNNEF